MNDASADGRERHEVGVKLVQPADGPVIAGLAEENVPARAVGDFFVERGDAGLVVEAARRGLALVPLEEAVAPSAKGVMLARDANHPVVAGIAEQAVASTRVDRRAACVVGACGRSLSGVRS